MLQAITEDHQPESTPTDYLQLPNSLSELLTIYENEEAAFTRICVLSKIKQLIMCEVYFQSTKASIHITEEQLMTHSQAFFRLQRQIFNEDPKIPNTIFSAFFLKFLRRSPRNQSLAKNQLQMIYHVVSLVIKYFYSEEHFKFLFNEITELIQSHKERIQTALEFFIEVIKTIQYNYQQSFFEEKSKIFGAKINHCKFERHFSTSHLNSMLMVANFFMQRAILKDNDAIEDGIFSQNFRLRASEEHICLLLELLQSILCFDFIGEKYSENEDNCEVTNIIIPTKNTKYTNLSQFEKWVKNSDWIRIYQFIYESCKMVKIKIGIIEILGDMARIHMKYFKNKNFYKVHIENIVYALADILEQTVINHSKEDLLHISLAFGSNLLKLASPAIIPIFFQINYNLYAGLLESVKNFLIEQIINEDVFNVNIIFFFFKFIFNLHHRCKYERTPGPFELIERVTRQISRSYENYLRILLRKFFKSSNSQKVYEDFPIRQDYMNLKQTFQNYKNEQITIFMSPFQFMKPRFTSINSIEELFVLICAKTTRSLYILETSSQNTREREFAIQMIEKSIAQTIEWFTFTTYFKNSNRQISLREASEDQGRKSISNLSKKIADNIELTMESINQEYEEEIQNEYEYCHILRVTCFYILECLDKVPQKIYKHLNSNNQVFKLINLCIDLCFKADLQQKQNKTRLNVNAKPIIEERLAISRSILERLFLKEWEYKLFLINRENSSLYFTYRFKVFESQHEFTEVADVRDRVALIQAIQKVKSPFVSHNQTVNQYLKHIEILLAYSVAKEEQSTIEKYSIITSLEDCKCFLQLVFDNPALLNLLQLSEPIIRLHFSKLLIFIRQYQLQSIGTSEVSQYLEILSFLIKLKQEEIEEEMTNRLFIFLYKIVQIFQLPGEIANMDQSLFDCLRKIEVDHLMFKQELQFQELESKIRFIQNKFVQFKQAQQRTRT